MNDSITVGVIGAAGRMGLEICRALVAANELQPHAALDTANAGKDWGTLAGAGELGIAITDDIERFLAEAPDVVVDVSVGAAVVENIPFVLKAKIPVVIGATGIPNDSIDVFEKLAEEAGVCCLIVPNFSIGANLMIDIARRTAPFFGTVEVIERHHSGKKDAPSGTALFTVSEMVAANPRLAEAETERESLAHVRGGTLDEVHVHSVRLPGILAEQNVIFGSQGETLEITHRSISRECFMPGVILAIKFAAATSPGLIIGLDQVLRFAEGS